MKGLIHSKKFRQNLYKWLFVYIGVLGLLATVVTYSKYISSLGGKDEARVTKFNVNINFTEGKDCSSSNSECKVGNHLPYQNMEYYFTVDPSELEVYSTLASTVQIVSTDGKKSEEIPYTIVSITEVDSDGKILVDSNNKPLNEVLPDPKNANDKGNYHSLSTTKTIYRTNTTDSTLPIYYKVVIKCTNKDSNGNIDYNLSDPNSEYRLSIGYSATQIAANPPATPNK